MEILKKRILNEGVIINDQILRVDSFLNHQIDPALMYQIGEEFAKRFIGAEVTKILTLESSGIAPAIMTGLIMGIPVVFARKKIPSTLTHGFYSCQIYSYTKKESVDLVVSNQYIHHNDVVLIVDDFLANGEAAQGMVNIVKQAGASLAGIGIVIEKAFQPGGALIRNAGIRLDSLIKIVSMKSGEITIE